MPSRRVAGGTALTKPIARSSSVGPETSDFTAVVATSGVASSERRTATRLSSRASQISNEKLLVEVPVCSGAVVVAGSGLPSDTADSAPQPARTNPATATAASPASTSSVLTVCSLRRRCRIPAFHRQARLNAQRRCHRRVTTLYGQLEAEAAAVPGCALHLDPAAEQTCVLLRDREAEPGALAAPCLVCLVKPLEQVRQVLGRNPRPVVRDFDSVGAEQHRHLRAAVLERVANEVRDDSLQPARVAAKLAAIALDPHALVPAARTQRCVDERAKVDVLGVDALRARVEARDLDQVLDKPAQARDVGDQELR